MDEDELKDRLENPQYPWNRIDYAHDAIIEASAGTGKTYALESVVLKMVCQLHYDARNILVVTFTEKAAGELENRIRQALDEAGMLPPDFDEMTICTIHAFCRRILTEYAFETGVPMRCEIGGDSGDPAHRAVLEALKSADFAKHCPDGLFQAVSAAEKDTIGELVKEVEKRVQRGGPEDWRKELDDSVAAARTAVAEAHRGLCALGHGNIGEYVLKNARFSRGTPAFYEWLSNAFDALAKPDGESFGNWFGQYVPGRTANPRITAWEGVSLPDGASGDLFDSFSDGKDPVAALVAALGKLTDAQAGKGKKELAIKLLELARPRFEELKKAAALLTFDDLVTRAARVVANDPPAADPVTHARFLDSIRRRYRVALVDEFQDTDANQWNIFRTLFAAVENHPDGDDVPEPKQGFLIVVGDPKQSIYSFRGADVGVYRKARDVISAGPPEQTQTLEETYRATRPLVDAFNVFFRNAEEEKPGADWFKDGAAGEGIPYRDVRYPIKGNKKFDGHSVEPDPVRLVESLPDGIQPSERGNLGNKRSCLPVFMENAVKEMKRLHGKNSATPYKYGEMCVLVDTNPDAAVARRILAKHGIPYGQYKQRGIFASPEAEGVLALLDYLANPNGSGNRAALLLSPMFGVRPGQLPAFARFKAFDAFAEKLRDLARERKWSQFFEAAMSECPAATASPRTDVCAFNRTRAAVRQIFDLLLAKRGRTAQTVADFSDALRDWRKTDRKAGENGELYEKESDADRVKIMTMHASKGLEFPVVFLAYGFSPLVNAKMTPNKDEWPAIYEERRRLAYVALTRAERLLYLPWSKREEVQGSGLGSKDSALAAGPNGFLCKAIQTWFSVLRPVEDAFFPPDKGGIDRRLVEVEKLKKLVKADGTHGGDGADGLAAMATPAADAGGSSAETPAETPAEAGGIPTAEELSKLYWNKRLRLRWDSFSAMPHASKDEAHSKKDKTTPEAELKGAVPGDGAADEPDEPSSGLLPGGRVAGNAFHEIMEALCKNDESSGEVGFTNAFADGMEKGDSKLFDLIRQKMRKHSIKNRAAGEGEDAVSTEEILFRMARNALDADISVGGHSFRLRDVSRANRLAETEFVVSETKLFGLPDEREDALNGKIDLLVRIGKKVFIIDWKTNSLANKAGKTDEDRAEAVMDKENYHLQYQLYVLAADAWLKGRDLSLAGVAYLFVRGGSDGTQCVIAPTPLDDATVERYRREIAKSQFGADEETNEEATK